MTGRDPGLVRTEPQVVGHVDGWSLSGAGREAMACTDPDCGAVRVPVEHGAGITVVHTRRLTRLAVDGPAVALREGPS